MTTQYWSEPTRGNSVKSIATRSPEKELTGLEICSRLAGRRNATSAEPHLSIAVCRVVLRCAALNAALRVSEMSTALQMILRLESRACDKQEIVDFLMRHLGEKFSTRDLHARWLTFRSRKSEINGDVNCPIFIHQQGWVSLTPDGPKERSIFWATRRAQ